MQICTDPRGPVRTIVQVNEDPNGGWTNVHLDCGHVARLNQIYTYRLLDPCRCFACGCEGRGY